MSGLSPEERAARYAALAPDKHPPIAFSEADWSWFVDAVHDLGLPDAIESKKDVWEAIYGHLAGCNNILNLTRLIEPRQWLQHNLLDSLAALHDPRINHLPDGAHVVDLGSGGGYPGLPLAVMMPDVHWYLLDRLAKKANFLNQAGSLTGARTIVGLHGDAAELAAQKPELRRNVKLIVSRAVAPAANLLQATVNLVQPHGHLLLYKGPDYYVSEHDAALAVCGKKWRFVSSNAPVENEYLGQHCWVSFERLK